MDELSRLTLSLMQKTPREVREFSQSSSPINRAAARVVLRAMSDGGEGSGNFNHKGRPGEVGGSGGGGNGGLSESMTKKVQEGIEKGYQNAYTAYRECLEKAPVGTSVTFTGEGGEECVAVKVSESSWKLDGENSDIEEITEYTSYRKNDKPPKFSVPEDEKQAKSYSGKYAAAHEQIDAAKSTNEVSQALRDSGVFSSSARCNLTGAKAENAKEVAHASVEMVEEYPWMKKKITRMTTGNLGENTDAGYSFYRNDITMDKRTLQRSSGSNVTTEGDFHPIGTGSFASIYQHEFGHAVTYTIAKKLKQNPNTFAENIRAAALKTAGVKDNSASVSRALCQYANYDAHEFIAESFAEYHSSPNPRPLCKVVVDEIKKAAKGAGFK